MRAATKATVHAFKVDALHERQMRQGCGMTLVRQIAFMREQRRLWAEMKLAQGVAMANAILASLERLRRFTRGQ